MDFSNESCFEGCDAPLCPLQQNTIDGGVWYPDEPFCMSKKFRKIDWRKTQKKISKRATAEAGYFTVGMLKNIKRVANGIKGIDPDSKKARLDVS